MYYKPPIGVLLGVATIEHLTDPKFAFLFARYHPPALPRWGAEARAHRRAGRASASSSSQPATAATKLTLHGGVPHHPSLAGLWRDVFGGYDGDRRLSTAEVYNPASDSWAPVTSLTSARCCCVAATL